MAENGTPEQKLLKQLQQSFKVVKKSKETWLEVLEKCEPEVKSVDNLTEQLTCCMQTTDISILSLTSSLPDVKEKLIYKLQSEIDKGLSHLHEEMAVLQDLCGKIAKQSEHSIKFYKKNSGKLNTDTITKATASVPSVVSMLQWLQEIEHLFHQRLCARRYLLMQYNTNNTTYFQGSNLWAKKDQDIISIVDEHLAFLTFFMEQKL